MFYRIVHIMLVLLAVAGYATDAAICYDERSETHCTTDHGSSSESSHQVCHDCVCHMPADVSHESTGSMLFFDEVKTVKKEHTPNYSLETPPDLQPPRLS